jgi:translation initiation factor 3 subunit B
MELASAEDAALAIRMMDGYPFDKRHKFAVNRFTDIEKLANLDEEYKEPEEEEYHDRVSIGKLG